MFIKETESLSLSFRFICFRFKYTCNKVFLNILQMFVFPHTSIVRKASKHKYAKKKKKNQLSDANKIILNVVKNTG